MTDTHPFTQLLKVLSGVFRAEGNHGGQEAELALRNIKAGFNGRLPKPNPVLQDMVEQALSLNPNEAASAIRTALPLLDWHYSGLADGRIPEEIAKSLVTCELIGPNGMVYHPTVRVGLFAQSANVTYVTRRYAAEETFFILGGAALWGINGAEPHKYLSGSYIHHPSNTPHLSVTEEQPVIGAWRWTGEIGYDRYQLTAE